MRCLCDADSVTIRDRQEQAGGIDGGSICCIQHIGEIKGTRGMNLLNKGADTFTAQVYDGNKSFMRYQNLIIDNVTSFVENVTLLCHAYPRVVISMHLGRCGCEQRQRRLGSRV